MWGQPFRRFKFQICDSCHVEFTFWEVQVWDSPCCFTTIDLFIPENKNAGISSYHVERSYYMVAD